MSRVIPQRVIWPGTLAEARISLQTSIDAFVACANRGRLASASAPLDVIADQVLVALSEDRPFSFQFDGWPPWFYLAFVNIDSNIRSGDYHLLPCHVCGQWMLVKSSAREKCNRPECRRAEERRRQAKSRENTEGTIQQARALLGR